MFDLKFYSFAYEAVVFEKYEILIQHSECSHCSTSFYLNLAAVHVTLALPYFLKCRDCHVLF